MEKNINEYILYMMKDNLSKREIRFTVRRRQLVIHLSILSLLATFSPAAALAIFKFYVTIYEYIKRHNYSVLQIIYACDLYTVHNFLSGYIRKKSERLSLDFVVSKVLAQPHLSNAWEAPYVKRPCTLGTCT